jgi:non-ribosomal peptide synthetase component F
MKNHSDLQELQDFLRAALCDPASPQQLAISGSDEALSWLQLSAAVTDWAQRYQRCHQPAGTPVVLYGHQQAEFAVAIYSCLLHNIPYIPVDCIYPQERLGRSAIWPAPLTITTWPGSSSPPGNGQGTGGAGSGLHHVYLRQHR